MGFVSCLPFFYLPIDLDLQKETGYDIVIPYLRTLAYMIR